MKKLLIVLFLIFWTVPVWSADTQTVWDNNNTDGTFNAVELPAGVECEAILLQVISSNISTYGELIPFDFSLTGNETQNFISPGVGIIIGVRKNSGNIGYVRAIAGYKVALLILY